ncbi:Uma2 family endonuclease [Nodosilinea sp. PGN35]|uniref:Uma2 family endonuclease n=1 Tax=Nodosilinea sp. PGN35 TaxID=3020489 RepID=UPI0023B250AD|nr:Uma2 family endonuclease [Nodosilinea sp. TSF1-S3]MDF0366812.1 Uma2 family endonuclease [Nodosilinea sp. TSF1-S3]
MIQAAERTYTKDEHLELEVNAEDRHEFWDGEVRLMTGGTPDHNNIAGNLLVALKAALRGRPYRTFILDQRLWIPACSVYTYPDVMVVPQPLVLQTGRTDTVTNPCFIAEVLSNSTKSYDFPSETLRERGDKFLAYRTIPTFQEYLLIDQYSVYVEHHVKTSPNQWLLSEYASPDVTLTFNSLNCQVTIADLYDNIEFDS